MIIAFLHFGSRKRFKTTEEIAEELQDSLEESFDDSDADKDYVEEKDDDSSSSSSEDHSNNEEEGRVPTIRVPKKGAEIRVYMDPPLERADGDTDKDKGGQTLSDLVALEKNWHS